MPVPLRRANRLQRRRCILLLLLLLLLLGRRLRVALDLAMLAAIAWRKGAAGSITLLAIRRGRSSRSGGCASRCIRGRRSAVAVLTAGIVLAVIENVSNLRC